MKGTCRISRAVFVFSILYAFSAFSEVFLWNNGSTDFNSPQSYKTQNGAIATRLPTSDDAIGFKEVSLEIQSGSEAMSTLNGVKYIQLDKKAQITFNCTEDVTLNCGIFTLTGIDSAKVIKRGAGTLLLAAKGKAPGYNNSIYGDAYADFSVEEGILKFYQGDDLAKDMRSRNVAISKGAVCYLPICKKFQIANLCGDGLLTNDWNLANGVNLGLYGSAGSFTGDVHGKFAILMEAGRTDLWGEKNSISSEIQISNGAILGLKRIGGGEDLGSVGHKDLSFRGGAGGIVYLGNGETFTRDFLARNGSSNSESQSVRFDAGASGGLDMKGSFTFISWYEKAHMGLYHLILKGSNTTEAVLSGDIQSYSHNPNTDDMRKYGYAFYRLTKEGSGTWYLKDRPGGRSFGGIVEVKNGTLKFDSVAEKGVKSSLGTASYPTRQKSGLYDRDSLVYEDYAFVLGDGEVLGAMEFVGTENSRTTSRPVVLNGIGALVNNSANSELRIRGVSAMNAGEKTLVLDGSNPMENVVWDVTDGAGTVSVEKRGGGVWVLGGTNSFSGNLTVKEGTLIVRNDKGAPYKWFKLVIKETASSNAILKPSLEYSDYIGIVEWGLYDANGRRVNGNINAADGYNLQFATLRPAQIAFMKDPAEVSGDYNNNTYRGAQELLDGGWDSLTVRMNKGKAPSLEDPASWANIVMRLADDAGVVQYYDLFNGDMTHRNRYVSALAIEGSTDGYSWEEVCSTNDVITAETKAGWLTRADSSNFGDRGSGVKGFAIRGTGTNDFNSLSAVQSVSVARGATLKAVGEIELSSLTVDCASGGGTIDGFLLASGGELRAVNVPKTGCDLPVQFANVQGLANLKAWNVSVDGKSGRMTLAVGSDGKVRLVQKGFMVICR